MFVEFKKVIRMEKISGWQVASVTQSLFKRTFGGGGGGTQDIGDSCHTGAGGSIRVLMERSEG